ncbi:iron transport multicopper oxidase fet3 [Ophiostoma piceae UAMH 11346]|uniref:Iron transport multicopper oxidase fet3 n=1 Tax=Ophiostoma piceae (strain UAMH 11346) TaxID=1262450 RepID=S3CF55_OPHP1|nr:iron transport multicopper oxidase fet3 [Ophiostoma piceae UAMH 11346]
MRSSSLVALVGMALGAAAKTVNYDFDVSWVKANPDGSTDRDIIGINGAWPLPIIEVDKGDRLIVNVTNSLGDKSTSIHWHGMFQNGTNEMDGASMFTQCPIPPGSSFTYDFVVDQNGTYWYHCHTDYCYPDGYRQALIVHDASAPFADQYEEEIVITLADWYHDLQKDLSPKFMSLYNPTGAEPIPDSFLMNDGQNNQFNVKPNTTYLLRIINTADFIAQYFYIEGHNFTIVEVDGVYTEPQEADTLYIHIAQRYSVLLTTAASTDVNYKIVTVADQDLMDTVPSNLQLNNTNWLVLNSSAPLDQAVMTVETSDDLLPFDDFALVPSDGMALLPEPDIQINVTVYMVNLMTGFNYAELNNITYTAPKVPSLYTSLSSDELRTEELVYGEFTHPVVLGHNQVVEIILNNGDGGSHPFHLHGHNFQVINREPAYGPTFNSYLDGDPIGYDPSNHTDFPAIPIRRDVVVLPPQGFVVLRFVADNPGIWAFHCHIDWHMASGLAMTFVEAPELIPSRITIPDDHYAACAAGAVPTVGNAAANTEDYTDLSGQNAQPKDIPDGFTRRGEVAMAFSILSALLGIASLVYYGLVDLQRRPKEAPVARDSSSGEGEVSETAVAVPAKAE